jgi:septum formation protein
MSATPVLWRAPQPLLLASTSLVRRMLLESAGLPVETEAADIDERAVEETFRTADPAALARGLAIEKPLVVSRRRPGRIVVGADQILALEGELLHRPATAAEAKAQLARLAGKTHRLHSAVAVVRDGEVVASFVEGAQLTMRPLTSDAIDAYAAIAGTERLTQSVGAYQLETLGIHLFDRVEGNHATILGLPLLPLLRALRDLDVLAL